ncbi:MAG: type II secretion system protein GspD [Planctomycetes bacterium]|nr:type II secretion system protein GspD [Planctomycetota bacterium]
MAMKKISKFLSDGTVILFAVLICALNVNVQAAIEGQMVTFTISGSTGQPGVTMNGLPNTVTDGNGDYSAVVKYGWKGTVTPVLPGFTFEPQQTSYPKVTSDQTNQDYVAKLKTYKISGLVSINGKPMKDVAMDGLPGSPVTAANGTYEAIVDFGFSGSAAPMKDGYLFTPGSKPYTNVNRDMPNQNYTGAIVTFTISGSAGVEGVTLKGLPGNPKSGRNGAYSVTTVPFNWTGMVKPEKAGYTFEPAEMPYTDIMTSYPNQDYYANPITFTISGSAGMDSVELTGLPEPAVFTDENGYYSAIVEWGWNGSIKAVKAGYKFVPSTMNHTKLTSDKANQNYTPEPIMLTISGSAGMEGVTMEGLPGNLVTGPGGAYSATVDWGFSGIVIPIKDGYEFNPVDNTYAAITKDQKNRNYTGKEITFTISGSVGVGGATLKGLPGRAVMSNPDGTYNITVKYGWNGKIMPVKAGYTFDPAEIEYPELYGNEVNRDYYASKEKRTIAGTIRTDKGISVEGIFVIADSDGGSATTNENGEYELTVEYGWRGVVTPTLLGHNFRPTTKRYAVPTTRNQTNQVFTAIVRTFTISDAVMVGGTGISGVKVTANNGGGTAVTNDKGLFSVEVPYNWTGEISLDKEGFSFQSKPYTSNIIENWKDDMPVSAIIPTRRPTGTLPPTTTPVRTAVTVPQGDQWTGGAIPLPPPPVVTSTEPAKPLTGLELIQQQLDELIKQREAPALMEPGTVAPQEVLITNTFVDDPLLDVLQTIAADANVTIIPDETVVGIVAVTLKGVPVGTALDIVLAGTPYVWKKTEHYYLVASGEITSGGLQNSMFARMSETRRMQMNYVTAQAAVSLLSTAFRPYVQAETPELRTATNPVTDTYTVVVTAPPALADRIIADLKKIDKVRQQVLLDARIVVMERGNLLNLGVQWNWPTVSGGLFGNDLQNRGGSLLDLGGQLASGFQIGYAPDASFTNALTATLNLLSQNDEATIIANPQILAQDGKMADISVMTEEYYFMTGSQTQAQNVFGSFYSELEKIESGTKLNITPHIGDNNDITLDLAIEVSDSIPRGRESDLPVVTRRTSSNTVRIKDGGTVALAGLTENRTRTDKRRVPGLSKLPFIGGLFKNTNDEGASREIAVFVTAHIIPDSSQETSYTQQPTYGIQAPMGQAPIRRQAPMGQAPMGQALSQPREVDFRASLRRSLSRPLR